MDVPVYDYKIVYPTNLDECRDPELLNGMPTVSSKVDEMGMLGSLQRFEIQKESFLGVVDLAHELQKCQDQIWQGLPHTHVEFTYGAIVVALIAITVIIIVVWVAMASVYRKHKAMMAARAEKEKENETNFFGLTAAQKADNASVENLDESAQFLFYVFITLIRVSFLQENQ